MDAMVMTGSTSERITNGGFALGRWCLGAALMLCCLLAMAPAASAAPSQTLVYSADGLNWSLNVTVAPGQSFYVRQYNINDTTDTIAGASVTTTLPAGFTRLANETYTCISPSQAPSTLPAVNTDEVACSNHAGQGGPIDESVVWSGQTLTISPTAGVYGQPAGQTSGPLAMGKKRYLNLEQCAFTKAAPDDDIYTALVDVAPTFTTATNTSNTADPAPPTCGAGSVIHPFQPANSGADALDLLGRRYFNLQQCDYFTANFDHFSMFVTDTPNADVFQTTTNTSNAPTNGSCGPGDGGGYNLNAAGTGTNNLDMLLNRYVNLHECGYYDAANADLYAQVVTSVALGSGFTTGTNAADVANPAVACGAGDATYLPENSASGVQALDTLDQARGYQFAQYRVVAPSPSQTTVYTQNGALTGGATASDSAQITVLRTSPSCVLPALQIRGCWHFDEPSGTSAADSSGNSNNATLINGPALGVPGVLQTAVQLDGVNDRINVPDSATLDVGDSFTLEGWVRRGSTATSEELFNKGGNGLQLTVLSGPNPNQVVLRKAGVSTIARSTAGVPADGSFHHVVATKNGPGSAVIYIDGLPGTTQVAPAQIIQDTAFPLQIGLSNSPQTRYDEFAIYDRALTSLEVSMRYQNGCSTSCPF